jgi:hypothetical protein
MNGEDFGRPGKRIITSYYERVNNPNAVEHRPRGIRVFEANQSPISNDFAGLPSRKRLNFVPAFDGSGKFGVEQKGFIYNASSFIPSSERRILKSADAPFSYARDELGPHRRHFEQHESASVEFPRGRPGSARNASDGVRSSLNWNF